MSPVLAPPKPAALRRPGISFKDLGSILHPTQHEFENQAVLNPACIEVDGITHMYYRAVRQGNYSSIGYCQLKGQEVVYRSAKPVLAPEHLYERHGLEDPRIAVCDGVYYLVYTAYDGKNARIAYATSTDLVHWEKKGVISPSMLYSEVAELCKDHVHSRVFDFYRAHYHGAPEHEDLLLYEKDALLFPRKVNGKFALVHRIFPEIQVIYFDDFQDLTVDFWVEHLKDLDRHTLLKPKLWFENRHIGGGCPPIETEDGWLFVYHAVEQTAQGRVYHAALALLDLEDPTKEIARLDYPLFSPTEEWELKGDVDNVVFPSGAVVEGDQLHIYYGAADRCIGAKTVGVKELLAALRASS